MRASDSLPSIDSTTAMLGSFQKPKKQLSCLKKAPLVSQAIWNITLASSESAYSIATYITDLFHLDPFAYGMSKIGLGVGVVGGLVLGGSETYSHWAQGSHFAHGDGHGHSHGGLHDLEAEEETNEELAKSAKLTWTQSFSSALHYVSESVAGTAFPLMAYKILLSMSEDDEPSPYIYAGIGACSLFCNLQTLLNTRSAFRKENEREILESMDGPRLV